MTIRHWHFTRNIGSHGRNEAEERLRIAQPIPRVVNIRRMGANGRDNSDAEVVAGVLDLLQAPRGVFSDGSVLIKVFVSGSSRQLEVDVRMTDAVAS